MDEVDSVPSYDDVPAEIPLPITPVRSTSETSAAAYSYSDSSTIQNESTVSGGSGMVPQSPQRSLQNSVASSPCSVNRSGANLSPVPTMRTPAQPSSHQAPLQPELNTPQFGEPEVGDLLGVQNLDFTPSVNLEQRRHYNTPEPSTNPRVLYVSDDEDTDPSSSVTPSQQPYTRNDATSTFGRVIQPLKDRMTPSKKRIASSDDEASMPKGAIIFGYLQKQGRNGKWQTRWFESNGESLTYYKSSKRQKLLATLDLAKVGSIKVNKDDPNGCSFTINISQRPYHLRADSKESCKDWVIVLNRVKEARLQEGNVKLVNSQPPDLLDSACPQVVVVAGRQRTHAVDDDDINAWETSIYNNPASEDSNVFTKPSSAKWQKSKRKLTSFASKVLRWARSIKKYGCAGAENHVVLDHHVHPPGHDDYRRKTIDGGKTNGNDIKELEPVWMRNEGIKMTGSSLTSNATNDSLTRSRSESEDARVLS